MTSVLEDRAWSSRHKPLARQRTDEACWDWYDKLEAEMKNQCWRVYRRKYFMRTREDFEDDFQQSLIEFSRWPAASHLGREKLNAAFYGFVMRRVAWDTKKQQALPMVMPFKVDEDGNILLPYTKDIESPAASRAVHTVEAMMTYARDFLPPKQQLVFLAYVAFVGDLGGGSNQELKEYIQEKYGEDMSVGAIKNNLVMSRRKVYDHLVDEGHVERRRLELKKIRSRWDHHAA